MNQKILETDLARFANCSVRTIRRRKKKHKEYAALLKEYLKSDIYALRKFLETHKIELMGNFGIYFTDLDDYVLGVLAEDTNNLIVKSNKSEEEIKKIEENLELLRSWL